MPCQTVLMQNDARNNQKKRPKKIETLAQSRLCNPVCLFPILFIPLNQAQNPSSPKRNRNSNTNHHAH